MLRFLTILSFALLYTFKVYGLLDAISISGNPGTLTISTATAGQQPTQATDSSTTYSVTTIALFTKIVTGAINSAMPANVTLKIRLTAPSGATSAGLVTMTGTPKNLVTAIPALTLSSNLAITYQLSATVGAAKVTAATKTLTLTLQ